MHQFSVVHFYFVFCFCLFLLSTDVKEGDDDAGFMDEETVQENYRIGQTIESFVISHTHTHLKRLN